MFNFAFFKSMVLKFSYVMVAAALGGAMGWVDNNHDVLLWSFGSLKLAVITSLVAAAKKFVGNLFVTQ